MKKAVLSGSILVLALLIGLPALYAQQGGWHCSRMSGSASTGQIRANAQQGWFCPMTTRGCPMQYHQGQSLTREQARTLVQDYIAYQYTDNRNLKIGQVTEKGDIIEAGIVTKDGSSFDTIQVDRNTYWIRHLS